jgi:hypothetical protein
MSQGNKTILEEMNRLGEAASEVKGQISAMTSTAAGIETSPEKVSGIADNTRATIRRMDEAIGRFKV